MNKNMICIECPKGCLLSTQIENGKIISLTGNECPRGEKYAWSEIENPTRILTSTVLAKGLEVKMVPVRTDKPIPKTKIMEVAQELKKITITSPVFSGEIIQRNFLELGVNLVATRTIDKIKDKG